MAGHAVTVTSLRRICCLPGHDPTAGHQVVAWAGLVAGMRDDESVPTLNDLARRYTSLTPADVEWLHALVSDWQLLADLSFADLVLWAPLQDDSGWVVLAQMRPTTGPTTFHDDAVGSFASTGARPFLDSARHER